MIRTRGISVVLSVLYVLLAVNGLGQALLAVLPHASEPRALAVMQLVVGTLASAVAWGCWRMRRWTSFAAIAYGIATGAMIASLGPLLDLPPEARGGLWVGAVTVLLFGLLTAWLVRRASVAAP
jgi:O-antigen ligase